MKLSFRRALLVLLASAMLVAVACGGSEEGDVPETASTAATTDTGGTPKPNSESAGANRDARQAQTAPERQVRIVRPRDGATLKNPVTLQVEVRGFQLVRVGTSTRQDEGLLHAFVDRKPPGQQMMLAEAPDIVRSSKPRIRLPKLKPGRHTVTVIGTYGVPVPFKPRVQDKVSFVVK